MKNIYNVAIEDLLAVMGVYEEDLQRLSISDIRDIVFKYFANVTNNDFLDIGTDIPVDIFNKFVQDGITYVAKNLCY